MVIYKDKLTESTEEIMSLYISFKLQTYTNDHF